MCAALLSSFFQEKCSRLLCSQNYNFGTSEEIGKKEFVSHVFSLILEELPTLGPVFLVFHDYSQDKK